MSSQISRKTNYLAGVHFPRESDPFMPSVFPVSVVQLINLYANGKLDIVKTTALVFEKNLTTDIPRKNALISRVYRYFKDKYEKHVGLSSTELSLDDFEPDYYDFLDAIPGIDIVEVSDPKNQSYACHDYVFGKEEWFNAEWPKLYGTSDKVIQFLSSKNYLNLQEPKVGGVIAYCHWRGRHILHYGKIVDIDAKGDVTVISKFGAYHLFKHLAELVPPLYGRKVLFFHHPC